MAEVTRWFPRTWVSALRNESLVMPALLEQTSGGGRRALFRQGEQEVLHGHVLVLEAFGLPFGGVEQAGQTLGDEDLAGGCAGAGDLRAAGEFLAHGRAQFVRLGTGLLRQTRDQAVLLIEECEQQVFPVDLGLPHADGRGLGFLEGFLGLLGETVHVHGGFHSSCRALAGRLRAG